MADVVASGLRLTPQPFETSIFGFAVRRLELQGGEDAAAVFDALKSHPARLVMCRIDADDARGADTLRALGFAEIEMLVSFERAIETVLEIPQFIAAGDATAAEACAQIARRAFRYDRFHADPVVPRNLADELKAAWARNNALGRADRCLLVRRNGEIIGFNQCRVVDDVAVIDLIAVAPEAQGQGLGRALINAALAAYRGRARRMRVGTQATNLPSVALYRGAGMTAVSSARTFHRWAR
jgi:ribosomal protein S18 acetylase RimI-like enzyme